MNILYIMRYWPVYGGGETITATLSNAFVKKGHTVHIAYQYECNRDPMPYSIDDNISQFKTQTSGPFKSEDVRKLHDYIVSHNIDIMINQWGDVVLCDKARKDTKCKLVTCWHLNVIIPSTTNGVKRKLLRRLLGQSLYDKYDRKKQIQTHLRNFEYSDMYVFLSDSFRSEFCNIAGITSTTAKLGSISNPLTYHFKYDMANYPKKKKQVLFVGRIFEYHKRLSYVLKVWQMVEKEDLYDEWNLVIVGDGPDMENTKRLAENLCLRRVSFAGFQNPRSFYEESSVFVMTSSLEGFGMTLVEAQQYACVPMAMDTYSSLHDIITDGENGIIVPDNALTLYGSKLMELMSNHKLREQLALNGLDTCRKFEVENIATQWENLFKKI